MSRPFKYAILLFLVMILPVPVLAHPGKTDGKGGHTDRSTGEYHYHHGYSAHQHYDMDGDGKEDCPYDFEDKTDHSTGTSNSENNKTASIALPTTSATEPSSSIEKSDSQKLDFWDDIFPGAVLSLGVIPLLIGPILEIVFKKDATTLASIGMTTLSIGAIVSAIVALVKWLK